MARTVEFKWVENDPNLLNFYNTVSQNFSVDTNNVVSKDSAGNTLSSVSNTTASGGSGGLDVTGVKDFRLQKQTATSTNTTLPQNNNGASTTNSITNTNFFLRSEILEDVDFDIGSEFETAESQFGAFGDLLQNLGQKVNLFTGTEPEVLNVFKVPTWKSTSPISINLKPVLYTRTNSMLDVLIPALSLSSMCIIKVQGKSFLTPGVFLGTLPTAIKRPANNQPAQPGKAVDTNNTKTTPEAFKNADGSPSAGFLGVRIPGLLKLDSAILKSCKPTFSKQVTESGGPLWCILDMKIETTLPATTLELFNEFIDSTGNFGVQPPSRSLSTTIFS